MRAPEAMQINSVRIVASTYFAQPSGNGLIVDGTTLRPPYVIAAIGDPHTMATAMAIPGGVVDSLKQSGASPTIASVQHVEVTALRAVSASRYAQPHNS